jgi:hypothetical protein
MPRKWIDSESDDEAAARARDFWAALGQDLDTGQFWAERIKQYRGDPGKRLRMAIAHLPLPAAFREAAIATRALIREKRQAGEPHEEELTLLYWLAAVRSFMLEYSERLQEPGFNVVEAVPGKIIRSLSFSYSHLGYEQLELLNKTDCKWLVEAWGEPQTHTTLNEIHRDTWREYEEKLLRHRQKKRRELDSLLSSTSSRRGGSRQGRAKSRSGCALFLALLTTAVWVTMSVFS